MLDGPKELLYYQTAGGKWPFWEWVLNLNDSKTRRTVLNRLERFAEGNPGHWRFVGQGIFELKIYWGPGYRVYFGCEGQHMIIVLIGGDKSTQEKDIYEAQKNWQDYKRRSYGA